MDMTLKKYLELMQPDVDIVVKSYEEDHNRVTINITFIPKKLPEYITVPISFVTVDNKN